MTASRRRFLGLTLGAACAPRRLWAAAPSWQSDPFRLGVASGYPTAHGAVLWTRLAPPPDSPAACADLADVTLGFEVAEDEGFHRVVRAGSAVAEAAWAHSVHVELDGLAPQRSYYYRFHAGTALSPVGAFRTAPAPDDTRVAGLRLAVVSCQHWETGYYAAYRHLRADAPDLVLHVGDYIYESDAKNARVRRHGDGEPRSLDDYRRRYALYRGDADLQAAHAAAAWLSVWDDHEVANDYTGDRSETLEDPLRFRVRRLSAYRAWYEHMPVPASMRPVGDAMRIYTTVDYGRLARFVLLDGRQYRDPQPCPPPGRGGSTTIHDCPTRGDPARSFLGAAQERWFAEAWAASAARWNLVGQQMLMAQADSDPGPGEAYYSDAWDGYPAARRRLLEQVVASGKPNPVFFGGDIHSFWVTDLKPDFARVEAPAVATEFVTTAVSSSPIPAALADAIVANNPHVRYGRAGPRGYLRIDCTPAQLRADLRGLADVTRADSDCATLASFVVTAGRAGAQPA